MLDLLFDLPVDVQPDLDEALEQVDKTEARGCLVDRLASNYQRGDSALFQALFDRLGVGANERQHLVELLENEEMPTGARATALEILAGDDEAERRRLTADLPEAARKAIDDEPLRELIADAIEDVVAAEALAVVAEHMPEESISELDQHLERVRKEMGAPASSVYEHLLCSKKLTAFREPMIDAIVEEATPDGLRLLECLRDEAREESDREQYARAIEQLKTRAAEGSSLRVTGTGRLGPIDASGRFEIASIVDNPDGTRTLAVLLMRGAEILDGYVDFAPPADLLVSKHVPQVEVPLGAIRALAAVALSRIGNEDLDPMTAAAVRQIERIGRGEELPVPEPVGTIQRNDLDALMNRPEYHLWAFSPADFHRAGIGEPPEPIDDRWIAEAIEKLDSPERRVRIAAAADFMSRWHLAAGEKTEASILARVARDVQKHFPEMECVRVMVRHSLDLMHQPDPEELPDDDRPVDDWDLIDLQWHPSERRDALKSAVARQIEQGRPAIVRDTWDALRADGLSDADATDQIVVALQEEISDMLKAGLHDGERYHGALERLREVRK